MGVPADVMRPGLGAFLVALLGGLGLFAAGPIAAQLQDPVPAHAVVLGSLVGLGAVTGLVGRGVAGLVAFYLGYGAAHLLAIGLGVALPPHAGEVTSRTAVHLILSTVGAVGYVGVVVVRRLRRRR